MVHEPGAAGLPMLVMDRLLRRERLLLGADGALAPTALAAALGVLHALLSGLKEAPSVQPSSGTRGVTRARCLAGCWVNVRCSPRRAAMPLCGTLWQLEGCVSRARALASAPVLWELVMGALGELHRLPLSTVDRSRASANPLGQELIMLRT